MHGSAKQAGRESSAISKNDRASIPMKGAESIDIARWCAGRGWPVHPLQPGGKIPMPGCTRCRRGHPDYKLHAAEACACLSSGLWCHGFHAATTNFGLIEHWWGSNRRMGVGIATGPAELLVVDLDCHALTPPAVVSDVLPAFSVPEEKLRAVRDGLDNFRVLGQLLGGADFTDGSDTLTVETPSGGRHLYFRTPRQTRWRCSTGGNTGGVALGWQLDVRAHGGYIVAPGTRVASGFYAPVGACRQPTLLPSWLAGALERTGHLLSAQPARQQYAKVPNRAMNFTTSPATTSAWARKVVATCLNEVAGCVSSSEGSGWHSKVNRAAFTLGGLVAAGLIASEAEAKAVLLEAALYARPHRERQALSIIQSGLTAGLRQPLTPKDR
ncbi:bifunctional DNA primase/polymerase [Streptomyces virginiae]|uniref:bifunctional DNA primase/polymerase n=1 Tax=Streptomyces virginiae TaxID=1961 RepID=UPI00332EDC9B